MLIAEFKETIFVSPRKIDEGTLFEKEVMCEKCEKIYYPYFAIPWNDN